MTFERFMYFFGRCFAGYLFAMAGVYFYASWILLDVFAFNAGLGYVLAAWFQVFLIGADNIIEGYQEMFEKMIKSLEKSHE